MVDINSGVPQGSVLGPLFLIIFMNDLPDKIVNSSCYLFADDSKLLSLLTKPDLQRDIDHFTEWAYRNNVFDPDRGEFRTFGQKHLPSQAKNICRNVSSVKYSLLQYSKIKNFSKKLHTQKMDRVARRGPLPRAPGALKGGGGHFRNCQHFCRS